MAKHLSRTQTQTSASRRGASALLHKTKVGALAKKKKKKQQQQQQQQQKKKKKEEEEEEESRGTETEEVKVKVKERTGKNESGAVQWQDLAYQATWLSSAFTSACQSSAMSHLEQGQALTAENLVKLQPGRERDSHNLSEHVKAMFQDSWSSALQDVGSNKEKGSPSLLILCSSALRCVELLKGLRSFSKKCKPAKLFAKHIKVEEQIKALEDHVNIAVGTPNRVKKLLDLGALSVSELSILLVDMFEDAKGFTIFTIPQVKTDFWELYKDHFHQLIIDSKIKVCLY